MHQFEKTGRGSGPVLFAVVLAAGSASRYGSTKQLASFHGEPLVRRALRAAEAVCGTRSLLVVGNDWQRVQAAARPIRGFLLVNDRHAEGMGTSIAAAARILPDSADGVLLMLADQPLIDKPVLDRLIDTWRADSSRIVCSRFDGTTGPPVIFPRDCLDELRELSGDRGAHEVVRRHSGRVSPVLVEEAATDVDTEADLAALDS